MNNILLCVCNCIYNMCVYNKYVYTYVYTHTLYSLSVHLCVCLIHICCSVAQSCLTLCNSMNCSTSGFSVDSYLPEFAQTRVRWVSDAIQPSHPLLPSSPLALNFPQHQGLCQWVSSSHQVDKVLELQLQYQSFQWIFIFIIDLLENWLVQPPGSPRDS